MSHHRLRTLLVLTMTAAALALGACSRETTATATPVTPDRLIPATNLSAEVKVLVDCAGVLAAQGGINPLTGEGLDATPLAGPYRALVKQLDPPAIPAEQLTSTIEVARQYATSNFTLGEIARKADACRQNTP